MPPAPKHPSQRVRRNKDLPMNVLPASGRAGRCPKWPIAEPSEAELADWRSVWKLPQAVVWESQHLERIVARYVRVRVAAEHPDASAAMLSQAVKLEERLLLTPYHLKQARYEIEPVEAKQNERTTSNVRRLRAVDPVAS